MKFYRRLSPIKAISFDLDDTLYSNKPIMLSIEKKMIAYFADLLQPRLIQLGLPEITFNYRYWYKFRQQAVHQQANLTHDVVKVRLVTYRLGFSDLGYSDTDAEQMAQAALAYFISLRSDFIVPKSSIRLLDSLSKKYPLVAITNGNVDTKTLGISHYFKHIYHAGWQSDGQILKQKPAGDMFTLACRELGISTKELLHVGDCGRADILGAVKSGCQAAWLSCYDVGKPISVLPHVEISSINQLTQL